MNFLSWLQLMFISLQLSGIINWSWLLVLAPTIVPWTLLALYFIAAWIIKLTSDK